MSPSEPGALPAPVVRAVGRHKVRRRPDWLINQLPMGMLDDDFLMRFLSIFQEVADSYLQHADQLEHVFDTSVAPDNMVREMGRWIGVGVGIDPTLDDQLQRRIVREVGKMLMWRGTERGMQLLLELITDGAVQVSDSGGVYLEGEAPGHHPHVVLRVESTGWTEEADLIQFVRDELPASTTFELLVGQRRIWPKPRSGDTPTPGELPMAPSDAGPFDQGPPDEPLQEAS